MPKSLPVVIWPDERLRVICKPVSVFDEALSELIEDMMETCRVEGGIGLGAPQVASDLAVMVVKLDGKLTEFVNPSLEPIGDEMVNVREACLSVPGYDDVVPRHKHVAVTAYNRLGERFTLDTTQVDPQGNELLSACLQHEFDHINGVTYVDKLSGLRKDRARKAIKMWLRRHKRT